LTVRNVASLISIALIAVLLVISVFIISNTIKLTTFDRRDEIAIMKMVGATDGFIRWPFVYEGLLIGQLHLNVRRNADIRKAFALKKQQASVVGPP
jgi:cell division transport system permease protein